MVLTPPIVPMLAESRRELPPDGALPGTLQFEPKADGFRAVVFARSDLVRVLSRQGSDLTAAFPDIAQAAARIDEGLVLDGELVVPWEGRLDFDELQRRARRRGRSAAQAAQQQPAYLITGVRAGSQVAPGVGLLAFQQVRDLCSMPPSAG